MGIKHKKAGFIGFVFGGGPQLFHKKTGKPIHMVREFTGEVRTYFDDDIGREIHERVYKYRPDRRFKPENMEERVIPPTKAFTPVYE